MNVTKERGEGDTEKDINKTEQAKVTHEREYAHTSVSPEGASHKTMKYFIDYYANLLT